MSEYIDDYDEDIDFSREKDEGIDLYVFTREEIDGVIKNAGTLLLSALLLDDKVKLDEDNKKYRRAVARWNRLIDDYLKGLKA